MILPDVNVLLYAQKQDAPNHEAYFRWLQRIIQGDEAYAMSDLVLSSVVRILTHPRIYREPSPLSEALEFVNQLKSLPQCTLVMPGPRHWDIFNKLCREVDAKGNLVPDAYFAAMAIESGCEWITTDRDYSRFAGLRWRHPLDVVAVSPMAHRIFFA